MLAKTKVDRTKLEMWLKDYVVKETYDRFSQVSEAQVDRIRDSVKQIEELIERTKPPKPQIAIIPGEPPKKFKLPKTVEI